MKFINVKTPLGIEYAIGTSEPFPVVPTDAQSNQRACQRLMQRFHKQGPAQWVIQAAGEASMNWLKAEGFDELKDCPDYQFETLADHIGCDLQELDDCLPKEEHKAMAFGEQEKKAIEAKVREMILKQRKGEK